MKSETDYCVNCEQFVTEYSVVALLNCKHYSCKKCNTPIFGEEATKCLLTGKDLEFYKRALKIKKYKKTLDFL